jgi:succinyl-CoA synthetase alpha subunit
MSILVDADTRILVQGFTGRQGSFHAERMLEYGSRVIGGVTPGKGGQEVLGLPVWNSVAEAVAEQAVDASIIFVPARFAADAIMEAADAGIGLICCITEHIPVHDMIKVRAYVSMKGSRLLGANCPGVISPGKSKMGIMPNQLFSPGTTGIVSRSGTLTYEVADALSQLGVGQSSVVGIGGDPIQGTNFIDVLKMFAGDPETERVVMIGEIGGTAEQTAAEYLKVHHPNLPVFGFIAGVSAPPGKRMGHAGAIVSGGGGTSAADKIDMFRSMGLPVADHAEQLAEIVKASLEDRD